MHGQERFGHQGARAQHARGLLEFFGEGCYAHLGRPLSTTPRLEAGPEGVPALQECDCAERALARTPQCPPRRSRGQRGGEYEGRVHGYNEEAVCYSRRNARDCAPRREKVECFRPEEGLDSRVKVEQLAQARARLEEASRADVPHHDGHLSCLLAPRADRRRKATSRFLLQYFYVLVVAYLRAIARVHVAGLLERARVLRLRVVVARLIAHVRLREGSGHGMEEDGSFGTRGFTGV